MKLCEHPEFVQAILRASEHFRSRGLRPALVEKDYYVTETLRLIAGAVGDQVIFKGGTSLSKGWNLIQRFSEDIDIFLEPKRNARAKRDELAHAQGLPVGHSVECSVLVTICRIDESPATSCSRRISVPSAVPLRWVAWIVFVNAVHTSAVEIS